MTTDEALAQIRKSICDSRLDSTASLAAWNKIHDELHVVETTIALKVKVEGELEKAQAACAEVKGITSAWPLVDVLISLREAASHLLAHHSCDCHGHEVFAGNRDRAQTYINILHSPDCGSALLAELQELKDVAKHEKNNADILYGETITLKDELQQLRERERKLVKFIDDKIAEVKKEQKSRTPFDYERGSDLLAYYAVKNFLKDHEQH